MATEYISTETGCQYLRKYKIEDGSSFLYDEGFNDGIETAISCIGVEVPAADVVPAEQYKRLLKAARAMHTWIFLNTCDEQKAYDECHLTDEDNALLGYGGQFILAEQQ